MLTSTCIKSTNRYVALDVETTGLSPQNGDSVIEIGVRQAQWPLFIGNSEWSLV